MSDQQVWYLDSGELQGIRQTSSGALMDCVVSIDLVLKQWRKSIRRTDTGVVMDVLIGLVLRQWLITSIRRTDTGVVMDVLIGLVLRQWLITGYQ